MKLRVERQQKLRCDECHYELAIEEVHDGWIGWLCPHCCKSMFTREDYIEYLKVETRLFWLQSWFKVLAFFGLMKREGLVSHTEVKDGETITTFRKGGVL